MKYFEKILFFLLLASIPIQLGKHFWPSFSLIHGIRVDYLSPTLYLSDIIFVFLFVVSIVRLHNSFLSLAKKPLFIFSLGIILLSTIFSHSPQASYYGLVKFFEFFYISFYFYKNIKLYSGGNIIFLFTLEAVVESIIFAFQFILQRSLDGPFYYLGERSFTVSTPGIATFQQNGQLFLRSYGTFPHPNVAAFYVFISFIMLLFYPLKKSKIRFLKILALVFLFIGIILTFSRVIILLTITSVLLRLLIKNRMKKVKKARIAVGFIIVFLLLDVLLLPRFINSLLKDWLLRFDLIIISFNVFLKSPLIGIGLNNFFYYESLYQKTVSPILFQPVHNIFLLWVVQTGILGFMSLIAFLKVLFVRGWFLPEKFKKRYSFQSSLLLLAACVIVGLFDHYLLTLQQGGLMLSFIIGIYLSNTKSNEA